MENLLKSIFAGICIGIAGTAYVQLGGGPFAACLFAIGLILIVLFDFNLYTGKIGYIQSYKDIPKMLLIILGNLIGCWLVASSIDLSAESIVEAKLILPLNQVFFKSIWCGFLMFSAVDIYKKYDSITGIIFCIPTFILCGFEHSIADSFYFFAMGCYTLNVFLFILITIVGNAIGANLFKLLKIFDKNKKL